jgi:hypothetical protein
MVLVQVKNIHTGELSGAVKADRQKAWEEIQEKTGWELNDVEITLCRKVEDVTQ